MAQIRQAQAQSTFRVRHSKPSVASAGATGTTIDGRVHRCSQRWRGNDAHPIMCGRLQNGWRSAFPLNCRTTTLCANLQHGSRSVCPHGVAPSSLALGSA